VNIGSFPGERCRESDPSTGVRLVGRRGDVASEESLCTAARSTKRLASSGVATFGLEKGSWRKLVNQDEVVAP
jgi:hypothetical protein